MNTTVISSMIILVAAIGVSFYLYSKNKSAIDALSSKVEEKSSPNTDVEKESGSGGYPDTVSSDSITANNLWVNTSGIVNAPYIITSCTQTCASGNYTSSGWGAFNYDSGQHYVSVTGLYLVANLGSWGGLGGKQPSIMQFFQLNKGDAVPYPEGDYEIFVQLIATAFL